MLVETAHRERPKRHVRRRKAQFERQLLDARETNSWLWLSPYTRHAISRATSVFHDPNRDNQSGRDLSLAAQLDKVAAGAETLLSKSDDYVAFCDTHGVEPDVTALPEVESLTGIVKSAQRLAAHLRTCQTAPQAERQPSSGSFVAERACG